MPRHQSPPRREAPLVLTHSRRSLFVECPYKAFVAYNLGLRPWVAAPPLRFGELWHRLMEAVYRIHAWWETAPFGADEPELSAKEVVETVLGEVRHEVEPWFWDGSGPDSLPVARKVVPPRGVIGAWLAESLAVRRLREGTQAPAYEPQELAEMAALATAMLKGYLDRWWAHDREKFEVLAIEQRLSSPITGPRGGDSWRWTFQGDIDIVVRERSTGRVYVLDHKTCAGEPEGSFEEFRVSPQLDGYAWLWWRCKGEQPAGVLYRASRKKLPSVPARNQCPGKAREHGVRTVEIDGRQVKDHAACTLCHGSGLGPLSSSACDTTAETYRRAMAEAEAAGFPTDEKHRSILAGLEAKGPRAWFDQYRRPLSPRSFVRWSEETWRITQAMARAMAAGEAGHWRSDNGHVCTMFGKACWAMPLCEANAPDTLALWASDRALQETFERRKADK